jgi:hypothetical protein
MQAQYLKKKLEKVEEYQSPSSVFHEFSISVIRNGTEVEVCAFEDVDLEAGDSYHDENCNVLVCGDHFELISSSPPDDDDDEKCEPKVTKKVDAVETENQDEISITAKVLESTVEASTSEAKALPETKLEETTNPPSTSTPIEVTSDLLPATSAVPNV